MITLLLGGEKVQQSKIALATCLHNLIVWNVNKERFHKYYIIQVKQVLPIGMRHLNRNCLQLQSTHIFYIILNHILITINMKGTHAPMHSSHHDKSHRYLRLKNGVSFEQKHSFWEGDHKQDCTHKNNTILSYSLQALHPRLLYTTNCQPITKENTLNW